MADSEDEFNAHFFEQFLDDYFAEADEHLRSLRRNLLDLEDSLSAGYKLNKTTLDELFRSFHTLKGISAMAAVSAAESLAHTMESYLRLLREGQVGLSEEGLSILIRGTQKIEEIVNAKREDSEIPSIEDETRLLDSIVSGAGAAKGPTADRPVDPNAQPPRYLFTFVSAPELAERGVNVNSVRGRLTSIGTVVKSSPTVSDSGQVAFEFTVETRAREEAFSDWAGDGISFERLPDEEDMDDEILFESPSMGIGRPGITSSSVVRVELSRLDGLMVMLGELVVSRARLSDQIEKVGGLVPTDLASSLEEADHLMERQLRNMRDCVMRTRMGPIGEVFERLEFAVRDLAREIGKKVRLEITGENTEIDKMLVEKVLDPLLHMVRNAVSHGIESPAQRAAANKHDYGTIRLHASTVGETILLEVADDGAGIDTEKAAARAIERGLLRPGEVVDDQLLLEILCAPGFSTRDEADKASGRGVGMDVVRMAVDDLGGTISLETKRNAGTTFKIQLPLTLAIADALIVAVGDEQFAVPQSGVLEVIEVDKSSVRRLENNEIIDHRGTALPLVRLSKLFSLKDEYRDVFHALIVGEGKQAVGVAVDRVMGQAEIVIRSLNDPLTQVAGVSGATELGDGRIVLILDIPAITRRLKQVL